MTPRTKRRRSVPSEFRILVSAAEREAIQAAAKVQGIPTSEWTRRVVMRIARNGRQPAPGRAPRGPRTHRVTVKLSADDRSAVANAADRGNLSPAIWARVAVLAEIGNED
jgi:uncharacterized protein (DUF1778 family)